MNRDKRQSIEEWETLFDKIDDDLEVEVLVKSLDAYTVEFPPEHVIQQTIDNCFIHVPERSTSMSKIVHQFKQLLHVMSVQSGYIASSFWIISILLFLYGYFGTLNSGFNPYKTIVLLAPVPFALGVVDLFRGVDNGMAEIELTCKMSLPEVATARFVLIGLYNVVLNSGLSLGFHLVFGVDLWKVVMLWLIPFTWVSSAMLLFSTKFRGKTMMPIGLAVWLIVIRVALMSPAALSYLLSISDSLLLLLVVIGVLWFGFQSRSLYRSLAGGMFIEFAN